MPADRGTSCPRAQLEPRTKMAKEIATGFPGRPPSHEWGQRLAIAIQAGAAEGCAAAIPFVADNWGFGSKINNMVNAMWVAAYLGSSIVWRRPDDFSDPWALHFENKLGLSTPQCSTDPGDWSQYQ